MRRSDIGIILLSGFMTLLLGAACTRPAAEVAKQPLPEPAHVEAVEKVPGIVVLTYNIRYGRRPQDGTPNLDEIVAVVRDSKADLVGLQEVERRSPRTAFEDQVRYLGEALGMEYRFAPNLGLGSAGYGNAVLSRFPIREAENHHLFSLRERRGLLQVTVDVQPNLPLHFFVTHLGLNAAERERHVAHVLERVAAVPPPRILVGDFNSRPGSAVIKAVEEQMRDAFAAAGGEEAAGRTFPTAADESRARIDYVFVSPGIQVTEAGLLDRYGSDHFPVMARLMLRPGTAASWGP